MDDQPKIIPCEYKPPMHPHGWYTIHWSLGISEKNLTKHLAERGLANISTVYRDKGGTIWVPLPAPGGASGPRQPTPGFSKPAIS